jgi:hypothetical protein
MGCENRKCIRLGQINFRYRYFMYVLIKLLRLKNGAHIFVCLNAVGYLRRTDFMGYVNTWKFMWLGLPYGNWGRLRQ